MKNNKGITLITLVITVIVMLILASVSVYSVVGKGKLSDLTQTQQNKQKLLTFKQQVQSDLLQMMNVVGANVSPTDASVVKWFEYPDRGYTSVSESTDGTLNLEKDGMQAKINGDFTVSVVGYDI